MSGHLDGYIEQERPVTAVPHDLARVVPSRLSVRSWGIQTLIWLQRPGQGFSIESLRERFAIKRAAWDEYVAQAEALGWTRKSARVGRHGEFGGSVRWFAHPSKLDVPAELVPPKCRNPALRSEVPDSSKILTESGTSSLDKTGGRRRRVRGEAAAAAGQVNAEMELVEPEVEPEARPEARPARRASAEAVAYLHGSGSSWRAAAPILRYQGCCPPSSGVDAAGLALAHLRQGDVPRSGQGCME